MWRKIHRARWSTKLDKAGTFPHMLAVLGQGSATLYRRIGGKLVFWRTVKGSPRELEQALEAARSLQLMAAGVGGWRNALRLGLDPPKPVQCARGLPRRRALSKHSPDGGLRKL